MKHSTPAGRLIALTLPVMMGYLPIGIVFGFLFVQSGAAWWLAPLMSLFVFAGASQFLSIALLAAGASLSEIAFACLIVNLRHIFYGISVIDRLPSKRLQRLYAIAALTDENYSLITGITKAQAKDSAFAISALTHSYWVGATLLGALLGQSITIDLQGLDFALTALFTVLAVEQFRRLKSISLPVIAILSYAAALHISPEQPLFLAICLSACASLLFVAITERQLAAAKPLVKEIKS